MITRACWPISFVLAACIFHCQDRHVLNLYLAGTKNVITSDEYMAAFIVLALAISATWLLTLLRLLAGPTSKNMPPRWNASRPC